MKQRSLELNAALAKIGIPAENRAILCLDGGGIRGILTIQLLKRIEAITGKKCFELFDMVAGTSTGGIIAGLIATGHSATDIEELYKSLVSQVFTGRFLGNRYFNPPQYTKKNYRQILRDKVGDATFQQACQKNQVDLLITSKDVAVGEETFFSYFQDRPDHTNTFKDALIRACMEATMSAPTYFTPFERFVDGGVTAFNNPTLAALVEAVKYGPKSADGTLLYDPNRLTLLSFGTGCSLQFLPPEKVENPPGPDTLFWLSWLMDESSDDASDMQSWFLRSGFQGKLQFRRFQVSLDSKAVQKLPDRDIPAGTSVKAQKLSQLTDKDLRSIGLDAVKFFGLMGVIGDAMAEYVVQAQKVPFGSDLVDEQGRDLLVSREGDYPTLQKNFASAAWVDNVAT